MNLAAYFERIGYRGTAAATIEALRALHRAHATAIPFENLDIHLGRPIALDIDSLQRKVVDDRRGGYCFEHNTLALHALAEIGFGVVPCEARVRLGATRVAPRTHMVLVLFVDGRRLLWDTGFGGETPLEPVPLDGTPVCQGGAWYRVMREGALRVVQMDARSAAGSDGPRDWLDLYAFVPEAREPVDFEVANWYTSTHPDSHFVRTLTAQLRTPDGWRGLRNLEYTETSGTKRDVRVIARKQLVPLLRAQFGLSVPAGTRFAVLEQDESVVPG